MTEVGLWLELDMLIGFTVGLGLGSLTGQRTVPIVLMTFLEIMITPELASHVVPYFLDGQRVLVGLQIPQMPTCAMVTVITGWIVGCSVIGAWRMATRDA